MHAYLSATGSFIPVRKISNAELSRTVDTSHDWIVSHTGIHCRHIAEECDAASDLAFRAGLSALDASGLQPSEIDLILIATATPDHPGFPSTACIVQHRLGADNAGAMDITAACTGFIYGLETARAFIRSGSARHVLVIGAELFSRILDWTDRNTCVLFGDGAGAVVVSGTDEPGRGVFDSILRSDGSGAEALMRPSGGSRAPVIPGVTCREELSVKMDGRKVYTFAVQAICSTIGHLLERNHLRPDDIAWIVPHQANSRIIDAAIKRMEIPGDRFYTNMEEYANTSAASIPIALHEMNGKGLLKRGDIVLTVGFGAGLTWGGNLIRW